MSVSGRMVCHVYVERNDKVFHFNLFLCFQCPGSLAYSLHHCYTFFIRYLLSVMCEAKK